MSETVASSPDCGRQRDAHGNGPRRGYVHVYTGHGKGKTTAAFGLALRASGHGMKAYIGQFLKSGGQGENAGLLRHPLITVEQFGAQGCVRPGDAGAGEHVQRGREGFDRCCDALILGGYDVVVLDEVDVAISFGLLSTDEVMELVEHRPEHVELVLTGREAAGRLVERADLVTEMREVKHYYGDVVLSRAGIEY